MTNETMLKMVNDIIKTDEWYKLSILKEALEENIRIEVEKSKGSKSRDVSIIKTITKESKTNKLFGMYHEFDYCGKSYKGFLEGHYILASNNDFGYENAGENRFKIETMVDNFDNKKDIKIEVDMIDLKTFIKTREDKTKPYIIEKDDFRIAFNPKFLLDCLDFCETNTIYCTKQNYPVYMKNNNDMNKFGLLLPVKIK